eukprot:8606908-Pyramimonas_sp.AAC.1
MALARQVASSMRQPLAPSAWSFAGGLPLAQQCHKGPAFALRPLRPRPTPGAAPGALWALSPSYL